MVEDGRLPCSMREIFVSGQSILRASSVPDSPAFSRTRRSMPPSSR
ncbi:hypothetical protein CLV71_101146 [Actinophytocola oryzae]|uniref:Uncharacterized protein n=1 Tax=Actinophytocola oryzae TaxID=502181 RepID=A0A4R7W4Z1_9PSEU|nr:hypothetical protein [Actinophytocola oryzae]TDV57275.1 hypothetical protein CLV71_101146 [Actinophytocola oryzae]